MRHALTLTLILSVLPVVAQAEFSLSDLVGTWTGEGSYYERPTRAKMKCRLSFAGTDAQVRMTGRCGSSLGAQDLEIDFVREGASGVVVRPAPGAPTSDSKLTEMSGQLQGNLMIASGTSGTETAKFQLESRADGTLQFVTQREDGTFFSQSVVTLVRR